MLMLMLCCNCNVCLVLTVCVCGSHGKMTCPCMMVDGLEYWSRSLGVLLTGVCERIVYIGFGRSFMGVGIWTGKRGKVYGKSKVRTFNGRANGFDIYLQYIWVWFNEC
jgi:hypothetical protein